jgi:hypothetical protein
MKGAAAGLSGSLALVLLLPMEAGVPIPVPGLAGLAAQDPVRPEPGDEPKVLVR